MQTTAGEMQLIIIRQPCKKSARFSTGGNWCGVDLANAKCVAIINSMNQYKIGNEIIRVQGNECDTRECMRYKAVDEIMRVQGNGWDMDLISKDKCTA